jgi:hypothetical protein
MYPRGGGGVSVQAGLSADELAALYTLYPDASTAGKVGKIAGAVSLNGGPVLGAVITAEDAAGNVVASTVTRANGIYDMPGMPLGSYQVRATPMEPANAPYFLFRGSDIAPNFSNAETGFLPTTPVAATVAAGGVAAANFALTAGAPAFRIGRLFPPAKDGSQIVIVNYPSAVPYGETDVVVGVYTSDPVTSGAVLRVSGTGITVGDSVVHLDAFPGLNPPLNLISAPLHIAADVKPGMRTLILQQGNGIAYANGYLEIPARYPDFNLDGVDDRFQHRYFTRWTSADAGPNVDPDHDGFTNYQEDLAGTNPIDAKSVLRVGSVRVDAAGATVSWPAAQGKRYQVFSRPRVDSIRGWQAVGAPVTSNGDQAEFLDTTTGAGQQFYRIQAVP